MAKGYKIFVTSDKGCDTCHYVNLVSNWGGKYMTDSPVVGSSSSVVSPAPSYSPPISTVPNGEAQLVYEARPCRRLWEGPSCHH